MDGGGGVRHVAGRGYAVRKEGGGGGGRKSQRYRKEKDLQCELLFWWPEIDGSLQCQLLTI